MKIVMIVHRSDGYTYAFSETFPVVYDSTEKALVDFENNLVESAGNTFMFLGEEFYASDFTKSNGELNPDAYPEFLTIDEWFSQYSGL